MSNPLLIGHWVIVHCCRLPQPPQHSRICEHIVRQRAMLSGLDTVDDGTEEQAKVIGRRNRDNAGLIVLIDMQLAGHPVRRGKDAIDGDGNPGAQDIQPVAILGAEDHFKMLFVNLLTNAVIYSHRNGQVNISCKPGPNMEPVVVIEDNGIAKPSPEDSLLCCTASFVR